MKTFILTFVGNYLSVLLYNPIFYSQNSNNFIRIMFCCANANAGLTSILHKWCIKASTKLSDETFIVGSIAELLKYLT